MYNSGKKRSTRIPDLSTHDIGGYRKTDEGKYENFARDVEGTFGKDSEGE